MRSRLLRPALLALAAFVLAIALVVVLNLRGEAGLQSAAAFTPSAELVARGAYLARAGNCVACHSVRGGAQYAGGRALETPFGTVYGTNLTADARTGIGAWSANDFWRAMHNGRSKDGRLLVPAFPYTQFTRVTRADSDALFAYLRTLPAVEQPNRPHALRFPYNTQVALALWRAVFFHPGEFAVEPDQTAEWNRGAYLVRGLGHCSACHGGRNVFGAVSLMLELSGGVLPQQKWYAPSLNSAREAGVAHWETDEVVALLQTGVSPRGSVLGPMAEVVARSTQYLSGVDLRAMAVFLKSLPQQNPDAASAQRAPDPAVVARGESTYKTHCEGCHGARGEGKAGAYPALAGNRTVVMANPANAIRAVLSGGFLPATAGNPRPYGMPPFGHLLDDADTAAVVTFVRNQWGNQALAVSALEVQRMR